MRSIGRRAAMIAVMIALTLGASCALAAEFGTAYNSSTVNLRLQPTQYSTWLGSYPSGTWVEITGESGNWYAVAGPDGKTGYMSKNYVQVTQPQWEQVAVVKNPNAADHLNLRAYPSYGAPVLGMYYNGAHGLVLGKTGDWYRVQIDGQTGYFRREYVYVQTLAASSDAATVVTPNSTALNLRTGPGKGYASAALFPGGQYVMVLQRGTDWWKVSVDGYVGFMSTEFLQEGLLAPAKSASGASAGGYGVVSNPRPTQLLNLREQPSTAARVIGQFTNGTKVNMLQQGVEWCKVQVAKTGATGYMMTDYLTLYGLPGVPVSSVSHPQGSYVNLRSAASTTAGRVLTRMPHGAAVVVLIPGDTWSKVRYSGVTGYAMTIFLK